MKIVFLTPGTGSYYCGACMRDNMLARELHRAGHEVTILPMYLPLTIDGETLPGLDRTPIFFGGINVYLQQKLSVFRRTPAFLDRLLDGKRLLRWAARHSHMTSAKDHGEMTLQMLNVGASPFRKEWEKLLDWIARIGPPDVVALSNALLAGMTGEIFMRFGCPVIAFFQGEDSFLDGLPEPYRSQSWSAMGSALAQANALLAPSKFYADFMRERLGLAPGAIEVLHNGIALDGFRDAASGLGAPLMDSGDSHHGQDARAASPPHAIGYLARQTRDKGLELLVDAFIVLARELGDTNTRLKIAGAATAGDEPFIQEMKRRLARAGVAARVAWSPNLPREAKLSFLRGLSLFSVPATYAEAFGLYVVEAMACGVPVVQPESAAFPEILALGGGGECVPPRDAPALARTWQRLLADEPLRRRMGAEGRLSVEKHFSARRMADQFLQVTDRVARATA